MCQLLAEQVLAYSHQTQSALLHSEYSGIIINIFSRKKVVNVKILIDGSYSAVDRIYNCCYKVMFDSFFFILVDRCEK